jgi:hypothetical protein
MTSRNALPSILALSAAMAARRALPARLRAIDVRRLSERLLVRGAGCDPGVSMLDLILIGVTVMFFVVAMAYVAACDRLR